MATQLYTLVLTACLLLLPLHGQAADNTAPFIHTGRVLIEKSAPGLYTDFFSKTKIRAIDTPHPPLARYRPSPYGTQGVVEFGQDLHRYKSEYTVATIVIPKPDRPAFDQYMTVLTALSLANEKAHFDQDKSGSLADFYALRADGKIGKSCALYGLQQHVSDIVMLDMAMRLENYFLRTASIFGRNAVTSALDRMELLPIYQEFAKAAAARDRLKMIAVLARLKAARASLNVAALPECGPEGSAELPRAIIERAVAPAYPYLLPQGAVSSPEAPSRHRYND